MSPIIPHVQVPSKINHKAMHPLFAWIPVEYIFNTFEKTTQYMCITSSTYLCKHHHSANPATNFYHCHKADATYTIFLDTPAVDGGETTSQLFVGCTTKLASVHAMNNTGEKSILGAFKDCI